MQLWALLYYGRNEIGHGRNEIGHGRNEIGHGRNEIGHGRNEIGHGRNEIGHGRNEIGHGRNEENLHFVLVEMKNIGKVEMRRFHFDFSVLISAMSGFAHF
jgi:hypothetical protein